MTLVEKIAVGVVIFLCWGLFGVGLVFAAEPEYSASPSADVDESVLASQVSCEELRVMSGDNRFVPAKVEFEAKATGDDGEIGKYRYHFGDGVVEDGSEVVVHEYTQAGEYEVYVEVEGATGFVSSETCKTKVNVRAVPLVSRRSSCDRVEILEGGDGPAPNKVRFLVVGADNKGKVAGYKMEFGDGAEEENEKGEFVHTYTEVGTYKVRGLAKDVEGEWHGGGIDCEQRVIVKTAGVMEQQPETGVPTWVLVGSLVVLSAGLVMNRYAVLRLV